MKKILNAVFMLSAVAILASCGSAASKATLTTSADTTEKDEKGFTVLRYNDIIIGHETVYHEMPKLYEKENKTKKGTVEKITYTTSLYGDTTYEKHANVYLPYGYNADDKTKKYNIVYMQHGDKRSENDLVDPSQETTAYKNALDNLFDSDKGKVAPVIVVFPTFYLNENHTLAGDGAAEDGTPNNYCDEITTELMPIVEAKYNTYTESFDEAGLIAARDHRAFTGYSRGSCATWMMTIEKIPYFRYFSPMSANSVGMHHNMNKDDEALASIWSEHQAAMDENKAAENYPFFIYSTGGKDEAAGLHSWINYLLTKTDYISYGEDPETNNLYYSVSNFSHMDEYSVYSFANTLPIFFK